MGERLDQAMVLRGLVPSRARARDLVVRGLVTVNGAAAQKPGQPVGPADDIRVPDEAASQVSRAAEKLRAGLAAFGLDCKGRVALDIGASTGGFTQVLLDAGADQVIAVDVGHGQLHPRLTVDPRVLSLEGVDARSLDRTIVPHAVGAIVADVSFISLTLVLPPVLALAAPGAWLVALVKPQFEAGRGAIGKGGIVRDPDARRRAVERVADCIITHSGWQIVGTTESPLPGGSGNVEHLIGARHDG